MLSYTTEKEWERETEHKRESKRMRRREQERKSKNERVRAREQEREQERASKSERASDRESEPFEKCLILAGFISSGLIATDNRSRILHKNLEKALFLGENILVMNFELDWD